MKRSVTILTMAAVLASLLVALPQARSAHAWKPPTHLFGVEDALQDVIQNGSVTIHPIDGSAAITVPVDQTITDALTQFPGAYRAGAVGPDAFPDLLFGQGYIHPDTRTHNDEGPNKATNSAQTYEWLRYLWEQAWKPDQNGNHNLKNIAFALGYMGGHANGDVWAHTWINHYADGVFPDFTDLTHADISVRHVLVEGYADKHRPGFEATAAQDEAGLDHTSYEIDAPTGFIADTLILSDFSRQHSDSGFFQFFLNMQDGLKAQQASIETDMSTQDCLGHVAGVCIPDPTDDPINLIELGINALIDLYIGNWVDDITSGLQAWPEVWQTIAQEMFTGSKPDTDKIMDAFKEWALTHLLSMMGLPDFVGNTIFFVSEVIDWVTAAISDALSSIFSAIESIPIVGDGVKFLADLYGKAKTAINGIISDIAEKLAAVFIEGALGINCFLNPTNCLNPNVKAALDRDGDGKIEPREVIRIFQEPEEYFNDNSPLGLTTTVRASLDADMHIPAGSDNDGTGLKGDTTEHFGDYDLEQFAPLKDTAQMAKLAMLDPAGLNTFVKALAGGNTAALNGLYAAHVNTSGNWSVPGNIMLANEGDGGRSGGIAGGGWVKSIDAEYQFRAHSPNDNHSYGTGQMLLWQDCVARDRVFRRVFLNPSPSVVGGFADLDTATGAIDAPANVSDSTAPVSTLSVNGGSVSSGGTTYLSGSSTISIGSTDSYWDKADLRLQVRTFDTGSTPPAYPAAVVPDVAPFKLPGADGSKSVQFFATDGKGICNQEGQQTRVFSLDGTPPKITVTSPVPPQTSYPSDAMLPLSFTADDGPGSGVDASTAANSVDGMSMPIPKILDLFDYPAGIHWYHAQEADTLGNLGTANVSWVTVVTASSLTNNLATARNRGCITTDSTLQSLLTKLQNAQKQASAGNHGAAANTLDALISEIAAKVGAPATGKTITPGCAAILTANATALRLVI